MKTSKKFVELISMFHYYNEINSINLSMFELWEELFQAVVKYVTVEQNTFRSEYAKQSIAFVLAAINLDKKYQLQAILNNDPVDVIFIIERIATGECLKQQVVANQEDLCEVEFTLTMIQLLQFMYSTSVCYWNMCFQAILTIKQLITTLLEKLENDMFDYEEYQLAHCQIAAIVKMLDDNYQYVRVDVFPNTVVICCGESAAVATKFEFTQ